ncbi:MFS transporter [Nonomuraea sp. NPDC050540]|uniref:MFS transporter n=1 Tax=Nonomuraea sp. NPDC050540 TaxID=3364367 RepID=UPI0037BADE7B
MTVPLRRRPDYRLLWASRTISVAGTEVSKLAVPLTGITLLAASPSQMGLLTAAAFVPALLFGLQAGAVSDRLRRHRPLMIGCELVAAAAALAVPAAWLLGALSVPLLVAVAFVIGAAGVVFRAANFPHLATVVPAGQRTEAMAGLQASYSVASVAGPGLGGLLVQVLTAPLAVLVEGVSFLLSALLMGRIRTPESHTPAASRGMLRDVGEGLRACLSNPSLRALLGAGVTINFFAMAYTAVSMLYLVNVLAIPKGLIGVLVALSGAGGLLGAWLTARLNRRTGTNRLLKWSVVLFPVDFLTVGLIGGPMWWKVLAMAVSGVATGMLVVTFATCMGAVQLREAPAELRGRVNATFTFAVQGVLAVGGLVGGVLAEVVGLRTVILVCAAGIALSAIWIWASPLRGSEPDSARPPSGETAAPLRASMWPRPSSGYGSPGYGSSRYSSSGYSSSGYGRRGHVPPGRVDQTMGQAIYELTLVKMRSLM